MDISQEKTLHRQIIARILEDRGIGEEEIPGFLNPELYEPTRPEEFPGMAEAAQMLREALERRESICVYGDYDVDGVTATALLVEMLRGLGARVSYKVPDRFKEGYGMKKEVITALREEGVDLIITCDCGISNVEEIALAKSLGMRVIVTDHHTLPDTLPEADVIVNSQCLGPGHRARLVPGVAVAYFLAASLWGLYGREAEAQRYLDLVALGVIADVVELRGENRYLAQEGLKLLRRGERLGISELMKVADLEAADVTEEDIGFGLGPRINAAGRMDTAALAVELLLSESVDEARKCARELDELNTQRRQVAEAMLSEAEAMLEGEREGPILLYRPHWHQGIIGITAGRLCEKYRVPAIIMALKGDGEVIVGSARSVEGVHIFEALQGCQGHLAGFGGHAGAAGLSVPRENLDAFTRDCSKVLVEKMGRREQVQSTYDYEVHLEDVDEELFYELRKLAPFGEGWPEPVFYCPEVEVLSARPTTGERHLRLVLGHGGHNLPAIWWWAGDVPGGNTVDALYSVGMNRWRGREEIQLVIGELRARVAEEKPSEETAKEPEWTDCRSWRELGRPMPLRHDAVYFHEGPNPGDLPEGVVDRYGVSRARHLVLLSCPPDPRVLREMILLSEASEVVLAYSPETADLKSALGLVMGYVKFVVNRLKGKTTLYDIAAACGQTEHFVVEALRFLDQKGLLEVERQDYGRVHLTVRSGVAVSTAPTAELAEILAETNAYRRYMSGPRKNLCDNTVREGENHAIDHRRCR